jgi:hypothetical protein
LVLVVLVALLLVAEMEFAEAMEAIPRLAPLHHLVAVVVLLVKILD